MRTKCIATFLAVASLSVAGFIQAQPNSPAPPVPAAPPNPPVSPMDRHDRAPRAPVIFLGVDSSPVPPVVSEQLGLPKGFGLVVDYVVPDSPAAAAGVQQSDIIKMLNDQILMEPGQLRKLLQSFPDNTSVTLTILRKGQEQKITVKLQKKEMPRRHASMPGHGDDWDFGFNGADMSNIDQGELRERLQEMKERMKEQAAEQRNMIHDTVVKAHEQAERAREEARRAAGQISITKKDESGMKTTKIDLGKAQIVFSDDKGELRIETLDGKKILTAKDPKGLLLFSGPVESQEEIDKVPAEVRQRYEKLQQRDLPSVVSADNSEDEEDNESADTEENDDDALPSPEQVSTTPQTVPHNFITFRTILI